MVDPWLRPTLAALVLLTGAACLQVAFAPLGPSAVLGPGPGSVAGFSATPLPPRPGRQSRDLALSATERQSLRPTHGHGAAIELSRTGVSVRKLLQLEVAAVTAGDPALALRQRRLMPVASGEIALGTIGTQLAWQGCRTWRGHSAVRGGAFPKMTNPPVTMAKLVSRLLGESPTSSYTCELLTLTTAKGPGAEARLRAVWDQLELQLETSMPSIGIR